MSTRNWKGLIIRKMNGISENNQNPIDQLIEKQRKIIKKLDEIKIKISDLKQAKKELKVLIRDNEMDIIYKVDRAEAEGSNE